jgi:uncharacterized membrane protein YkoI
MAARFPGDIDGLTMRKAVSTNRYSRTQPTPVAGVLAAVVLAVAATTAAEARVLPQLVAPPPASSFVATQRAQRGPVTLEQAVEIAQRRYEGTVAGARTISRGGRQVHEVRILGDDGRVRTVLVDAETGEVG